MNFGYDGTWLADPGRFNVSADLQLAPGHQPHKAASPQDSVFHGAIADTAPDAWGRRVIARDHARRRKADPQLPALTELDCLLAVDDFSRVGALRLRDEAGAWCQTTAKGRRSTPPLIELEPIYQATRAVELGQESAEDLRYLNAVWMPEWPEKLFGNNSCRYLFRRLNRRTCRLRYLPRFGG